MTFLGFSSSLFSDPAAHVALVGVGLVTLAVGCTGNLGPDQSAAGVDDGATAASTASAGGSSETTSDASTGAGDGGGAATTSGAGGAGGSVVGGCQPAGSPEALNPPGGVNPTGTYSDWGWPAPPGGRTSMEWTLNVDFEIPNDGYFWSHQFGFANPGHSAGYVGMQDNGYYVADPPNGFPEITKMALFSIGPGAILAESGQPYPDGRAYSDFDGGAGWNVHIKYAWKPCTTYAFRIAHQKDEPSGDQWYEAYVEDTDNGIETFIGRILVPGAWGRLGSSSVYFSERFGYQPVTACDLQQHASAVFGIPTVNQGSVAADGPNNHFHDPTDCPNARFTTLPGGVRHEMGVPAL